MPSVNFCILDFSMKKMSVSILLCLNFMSPEMLLCHFCAEIVFY